ncbi:hypothetical protein [Aestuariirhabdus litorea]|uniref:Phosphodiesterase n=1 Tax=Aestuariirhabdus litorea TaxID=2528527 RepID=A0A3P3VSK7_9GAMM|nr:hypothetical protein [Aestuariirhabdus litorea]RRJ84676.1 hypothetical protein D0544_06120 [Aestuariirhabdus litorea]RWW97899.1 hypothetical protein DZC74_06115 [Endozoicomonadaceae bacterium GTF-13]
MKKTLLLTALLASTPMVLAEQIRVDIGQQSPELADMARPQAGETMQAVEQAYGAPQSQSTVGSPPITTWRYENFSVYFEGDRVLHSVLHKKARSN